MRATRTSISGWRAGILAALILVGAGDRTGEAAVQQRLAPSNPRWSPDGEAIAFYANVGDQTDIFVRSSGGTVRRLTHGETSDYGPEFSPSGDKIAFYTGSGRRFGIEVMRLDGSGSVPVSCGGEYEGNPHFSPDGQRLVFSSNRDGNHEIYVATLNDSSCRRITQNEFNDWTPRFSPDGGRIVFASDRGGQFDIYTMAADGSDVTLVADVNEHDYYPDWSPDGSRIAFFSGPDYDTFEIHIVDVASGQITQLTRPPVTATNPAWSPDGEWLLVAGTRDGVDGLLLVRHDGSEMRSLDVDALPPDAEALRPRGAAHSARRSTP